MNQSAERSVIRKRLYENYFELYHEPITLSAGDAADNKIDLEPLRDDPAIQELVLPPFLEQVAEHEPDFVVGVPNGATWLAEVVADRLGCEVCYLTKNKDTRVIRYAGPEVAERIVNVWNRGVLIEDVSRTYLNVRRTLALPGMNEKIVGVESVIDRASGQPDRQLPDQPCRALVSDMIPERLSINAVLREQIRADYIA